LTEELLATAKQNEISGSTAAPNAGTSPSLSIHKENQMVCSLHSRLILEFTCTITFREIGNND